MPYNFNVSNIFECGRKLLEILDVSYERECMATQKEEYFTKMFDYLIEHYRRHGQILSSKKL